MSAYGMFLKSALFLSHPHTELMAFRSKIDLRVKTVIAILPIVKLVVSNKKKKFYIVVTHQNECASVFSTSSQ